jgi:hypothetical protein
MATQDVKLPVRETTGGRPHGEAPYLISGTRATGIPDGVVNVRHQVSYWLGVGGVGFPPAPTCFAIAGAGPFAPFPTIGGSHYIEGPAHPGSS